MEVTILVWMIFSIFLSLLIGKFLISKTGSFSLKKANQEGVRFSSQTKPIYGGVIFYIIFVLSIIFSLFISADDLIIRYLFTFLIVGTVGFFIGLADDLLSLSPFFKFFGQTLVAGILIFLDVTAHVSSNELINALVTYIWVITIMNSINLLDNMDAISGTITTLVLIAVMFILLASSTINFPIVILLAGIIGSLIGFMKYNWNPAKIYMGDNGSQFLGAILAIVGIMYFWNGTYSTEVSLQKSFWATLIAFLIPLVDTTSVFINRISRGRSPFVGGSDHTTHHLYYLGLSVKQVAYILSFLTVLSLSISIYIVIFVETWTIVQTLIFGGYALFIFMVIYSITKISKPKQA